jgi:hypothetical protein
MFVPDRCLIRSREPYRELVVRLGLPLVDDHLEFLGGRCRTEHGARRASDLRVFFTSVGKPAEGVPLSTCSGSLPPSALAAAAELSCSRWTLSRRTVGLRLALWRDGFDQLLAQQSERPCRTTRLRPGGRAPRRYTGVCVVRGTARVVRNRCSGGADVGSEL